MRPGVRQRYEKFAREYVIDQNGTRAAIAAGYSARSATSQASDLLRIPKVQALIDSHLSRQAEKAEVTAEKIVSGLSRAAFFDPRRFFDEDGELKTVSALDDEAAGALAGMEIEKLYEHFSAGKAGQIGTVTKVKFADRLRALELLGKHFKLFTEKSEMHVSSSISLSELIEQRRKKVQNGNPR